MNLVKAALMRVPEDERDQVASAVMLLSQGYGVKEVGKALSVSWREVERLREVMASAMLAVMREDGFTETEIIRSLRVPTAIVSKL